MRGSYRPDYDSPAKGEEKRVKLPVYINPDADPHERGNRRRARGAYIRRQMWRLRLDYETVAEVLGVTPHTVRNWEKAKSIKPLVKLAFDKAFVDRPRHERVVILR